MRYYELFQTLTESTAFPRSFWINANTNEILPTPDEHVAYIFNNPEKFNLTKKEIYDIQDQVGDGWTPFLMDLVGKDGWVRGGVNWIREYHNAYFLQGREDDYLRKAAVILSNHVYFDALSIDTFLDTFSPTSFITIVGNELEHWLKTGKFLKRSERRK